MLLQGFSLNIDYTTHRLNVCCSQILHAHCVDIGHKIRGVRAALIIFMVYGFPPRLPSSGPRYEGGYVMYIGWSTPALVTSGDY